VVGSFIMKITVPSTPALHLAADPRSTALVATKARTADPVSSPASEAVAVPPCPTQFALLVRSLLATDEVTEIPGCETLDGVGSRSEPRRVLKPWGIEMLPADKPDRFDDRSSQPVLAGEPMSNLTAAEG